MAVQLPEPDYYTLEEVTKRWGITIELLLRIAREGKIQIGFKPPHPFLLSVYGSWDDENGDCHDSEIPVEELDRATQYPLDKHDGYIITSGKILLHASAVPDMARRDSIYIAMARFSPSAMLLWPNETIPGLSHLPREDWFFMIPVSIRATVADGVLDGTINIPVGMDVTTKYMVRVKDLIVPTWEVHRIERQHEAAEQAAADDPLSTKEKETLQSIIAAMATMIANREHKFRRDGKPNALQIAQAILELKIIDKTEGTIRKAISKALKSFTN